MILRELSNLIKEKLEVIKQLSFWGQDKRVKPPW
jgi:hypothetical protein